MVLNVEVDTPIYSNCVAMVGIDVGIKDFYTDNNGYKCSNPKYLNKSLKKLAKEQKKLSRMVKGSSNWEKQRIKVAKNTRTYI